MLLLFVSMAGSATTSVEQVDKITLKVMVDKKWNKVLYADAEKNFVDVLLSFLTLPLGTISRLVSKESNIEAMKFGSISSLYQSVQDLDGKYLWSQECKEMLLKPRNFMEGNCQKLKLNIDDTPVQYFSCANWRCRNCVSIFRNQRCPCGMCCNVEVPCLTSSDNGFVKDMSTFIIHDDLSLMPNDLVKGLGFAEDERNQWHCRYRKKNNTGLALIDHSILIVQVGPASSARLQSTLV